MTALVLIVGLGIAAGLLAWLADRHVTEIQHSILADPDDDWLAHADQACALTVPVSAIDPSEVAGDELAARRGRAR